MPTTGKAFDWRAFWADLLQGAGRGLLELDGSGAAQAAMYGLDNFEAARRRREKEEQTRRQDVVSRWLAEALKPSGEAAQHGAEDDIAAERAEHWRRAQLGLDPHHLERAGVLSESGLPPSVRPQPFSANPYDELPQRLYPSVYRGAPRRYARQR